jgi:SDR family mycofactocin-dependent oxidoreductase
MGRLDGKVAMITGGARGQGRSHAIRLAEEGAQIVLCDIASQLATVPYPMGNENDLQETVRLIEDLDQRCVAVKADARDLGAMKDLVGQALSEFDHIDILCVNHGIASPGGWDSTEDEWDEMLDVNLKGVWVACKAVIPHMIERGQGGAIVLTASAAGLRPFYGITAYSVAKHGVIGLMRNLASELGPERIRVNAVCPTVVDTPMVMNQFGYTLFSGGKEDATRADIEFPSTTLNLLPIPWVDARDISNAVLWLVSDEARYVTGVALPVDAGLCAQPPGIPPAAGELLASLMAD